MRLFIAVQTQPANGEIIALASPFAWGLTSRPIEAAGFRPRRFWFHVITLPTHA